MNALQTFLAHHTSINQDLQRKHLKLAQFDLESNNVECQGIDSAFPQKIGTAMGASFAATHATIFMIWLQTPIIDEFHSCMVLYTSI